jgi:anhydro-N-acetylmuramic acid kinase
MAAVKNVKVRERNLPKNYFKNKAGKCWRIAGLMSGTSADGVDVAIMDYDGRRIEVLAFDMFPYSKQVRQAIFELFDPQTSRVDTICQMNFVLGEIFAESLIALAKRKKIPLDTIDLVGSHGQTIYHVAEPQKILNRSLRSTLQIGEPSIIAERTGCTVVADFRPRDIAAGGSGAPLVPYADLILFGDGKKNRALQNIGGIANVTWLPAGGGIEDILAFDTGPGNMIIDRVVSLMTDGKKTFDESGRIAAMGCINHPLLDSLMKNPYFKCRPPKSTGRELFGTQFTDKLYDEARKAGVSPVDIVTTVTVFTARTIAEACRRFLPAPVDEMILCGGGARNVSLNCLLEHELKTRVRNMEEFGIDPDAKEAISFAILAYATMMGQANNVPGATGAQRPVVLGKIIPGGSWAGTRVKS